MRKTVSIVCFLFLAASLAPAQAQTKPGKASRIHPLYQRWVSEEVAYIINAAEKKQYFDFETDAEREQFISQFWQVQAAKVGVSTEE